MDKRLRGVAKFGTRLALSMDNRMPAKVTQRFGSGECK
jgi:hypothetical protein